MSWSSVKFLETGDAYFQALLEEFARAQHSILLEFYIFEMDRLGKEVLESLRLCRERGLKVFLRLDGIGSREHMRGISQFCETHDLELEVFHPLPFEYIGSYFPVGFAERDSFFTRWKLMNRRSHRKLVVIDETVAFIGGTNVVEAQSERYSGKKAWHDLSVRLEGPAIAELVHAFWFRPFHHYTIKNCLLNYSWRLRQARNAWISRAITQANERIWIITPYFAPTPTMLFHLKIAAKRGVDIRLIFTKKIDVWVSRLAALGLYRKLILWGIKVYEYDPTLLHRKLWIMDNISFVGSANFNHRSFIHDLEIDVILREPAHVQQAQELFRADQNDSKLINENYLQKLSLKERFLSWLAGWFTYWL